MNYRHIMKRLKKEKKQFDSFIRYPDIGIQMLVIIAAGAFGGLRFDQGADNKIPVFLLTLFTPSMPIAIYHAIKDFIR